MKITFVSVGERIGYKASYNHKGVQIVHFAPTRLQALADALKELSAILNKN